MTGAELAKMSDEIRKIRRDHRQMFDEVDRLNKVLDGIELTNRLCKADYRNGHLR